MYAMYIIQVCILLNLLCTLHTSYIALIVMPCYPGLCPPQEDPGSRPGPAPSRAQEEGALERDRRRRVSHLLHIITY